MTTYLEPTEYDASYFDGATQTLKHNAGYGHYRRWYRNDSEYYKDIAIALANDYALKGLRVLEIGCAKGFIVKDLRDLGVDAYGIDVSDYAIGEAEEGMAPYLSVKDAMTDLIDYKDDEFDYVYTRRFLECIDPLQLKPLILEMNRISKRQVHVTYGAENDKFYAQFTKEEMVAREFKTGTEIIEKEIKLTK